MMKKQTKHRLLVSTLSLLLMVLAMGCAVDDPGDSAGQNSIYDNTAANGMAGMNFTGEWQIDGRKTGIKCNMMIGDGRIQRMQLPLAALVDTINAALKGQYEKFADDSEHMPSEYILRSEPIFSPGFKPLGYYQGDYGNSVYYSIERTVYTFRVSPADNPTHDTKATIVMSNDVDANLMSITRSTPQLTVSIHISELQLDGVAVSRSPNPIHITYVSTGVLNEQ